MELGFEVFREEAPLGTRLYFVLLGFVSADISARKEFSSFSAISSRDNGFGCDDSPKDGGSEGGAPIVLLSCLG